MSNTKTLKNRRFRVNQLLKAPVRQTRRFQRQAGKRFLVKPAHLRFSNVNNYSNNNWNNYSNYENNNINHMRALVESRKSIMPSQRYYNNAYLTPNQAKLFANISLQYNTPEEMYNRLFRNNITNKNRNALRKKINALYH
jgi:prophage DNA circulation protein